MKNPKLEPHEQAALDEKRETHSAQQPYASEVDDRELERAQKERRPGGPSAKPRPGGGEPH